MQPALTIHRWRLALAGAVLAALLAGCGSGGSPQVIILAGGGVPASSLQETGDSGVDLARGQRAFEETCAACHGSDGRGLPGLGKDLVTPSDWFRQQDDESLVQFLKVGRTAADPLNTTKVDMPPRGGNPALSDDDLRAIVLYLRSIQE